MEEKEANKIQEKEPSTVSRRDFLKSAGVVAGGAAAAGGLAAILTGCQPAAPAAEAPAAPVGEAPAAPVAPAAPAVPVVQECPPCVEGMVEPAFEAESSMIRGSSFMGFGRDGMPTRVEVKNGRIVRIRPLHYADEGYTPEVMKPWTLEKNGATIGPNFDKTLPSTYGLAYKRRVYSPNRIRYPLQRVDWEPGGDPAKINPQNRGISKFKRISWDEATTIIAGELLRIQEKYGHMAVAVQGDGHGEGKTVHGPHGCMTHLLRYMGPDEQSSYTLSQRVADSWEGWYWGGKHVNGWETTGTSAPQGNNTKDMIDNCELMYVSTDQETTSWAFGGQFNSRVLYWLSAVGIEQVYIGPELCYAAAVHADKWIPILPCQDGALYAAIAHVWLTEDTYDKEYVATHVVGFEAFSQYILGNAEWDTEGPKTPEWAEPRCGVPAWTIKAMARNWFQKRTSVVGFLGPGMRGTYSSEPTRMQTCCEGMQGLGAPGRQRYSVGGGLPGRAGNVAFDTTLVQGEPAPARGLEEHEAAADYFRPHQYVRKVELPEAILNPPISWFGTGSPWMAAAEQSRPYTFPIPAAEGGGDIHMLWTSAPCWTTCWNGGNKYLRAVRSPKIELMITEHPWMEDETTFSDIILPTTTRFEEYDISAGGGDVWMVKDPITPIGEAKTDYEVSLEIAKKLGDDLVEKYTWGRSVEDWMKLGWDTRELEPRLGMTWEEFKERGFAALPFNPEWQKGLEAPSGHRLFYEDPTANPLKTPTGLLEFESTFLKENFPDDTERRPVPQYIAEGETHQDNHLGERGQLYPLYCQSNHPKWRCHAEHDDISWLREIPTCKVRGVDGYMYEPIWIHPSEAEKRGIKNGDIIGMYNERGTVLGGAYVTERVRPGVAYQDHGARVDYIFADPEADQSEFIDRGGANNLICPEKILSKNCGGQVGSGFLVEVKKINIFELMEKYPEGFAKEYDPASGLLFRSWVEGGEL